MVSSRLNPLADRVDDPVEPDKRRPLQTIGFAMLMQMVEERPANMKSDPRFQRLEEDIRDLRAEQKAGVNELRGEIHTSAQELRGEIQVSVQELRGEIQLSVQQLRGEIQVSVQQLRDDHREMRADIRAMQRNMLFGFFSLAGLFLTYAGFQLS